MYFNFGYYSHNIFGEIFFQGFSKGTFSISLSTYIIIFNDELFAWLIPKVLFSLFTNKENKS